MLAAAPVHRRTVRRGRLSKIRRRIARKDISTAPKAAVTFAAMSRALLLAESEHATRGFLERHLVADGFHVVGVDACGQALELAERTRPDLVLIGTPFSDATPLELCRRLREGEPGRSWDRDVPLILLGQPDADALERVRALERGFDDYVEKPFVYDELLARIRAVLRRALRAHRDRLQAGDVVVDRATRRVTVQGRLVVLSGKEFELLAKLAEEPQRVHTKQDLLRDVWGYRSPARTRTLDSHASRLRRKLGDAGNGPYVLNVWGVGYRLLRD
jgi:DNA-binding response OmpR family regulator